MAAIGVPASCSMQYRYPACAGLWHPISASDPAVGDSGDTGASQGVSPVGMPWSSRRPTGPTPGRLTSTLSDIVWRSNYWEKSR
jgi:hypothetical protein